MATNHASRFEREARARKVAALVVTARRISEVLTGRPITAERVATEPGTRSMLVNVAGVLAPSDETWAIVVHALADLERLDETVTADPYEGVA